LTERWASVWPRLLQALAHASPAGSEAALGSADGKGAAFVSEALGPVLAAWRAGDQCRELARVRGVVEGVRQARAEAIAAAAEAEERYRQVMQNTAGGDDMRAARSELAAAKLRVGDAEAWLTEVGQGVQPAEEAARRDLIARASAVARQAQGAAHAELQAALGRAAAAVADATPFWVVHSHVAALCTDAALAERFREALSSP
jgi:hypothetical protein